MALIWKIKKQLKFKKSDLNKIKKIYLNKKNRI